MTSNRLSQDPHRRRRLGLAAAVAFVILTAAAGPPTHRTLRVIWQQELPPYPSGPALDVRWASDATVLLAWLKEGVFEVALDGKFSPVRALIPDPEHRFRGYEILAASPEYVISSSAFKAMAFRLHARQSTGLVAIKRAPIGIVEGMDLAGHELALLGNPTLLPAPNGAVAWLGDLSEHPERDLKPLPVYDHGATNPETWESRTLANCSTLQLGSVRFLPDRSLIVVPGFEPGAYLFTSGGRLLRSFDAGVLGLDTAGDCAAMGKDEKAKLAISAAARFDFLNKHRVLDDILPLPAGPGLLIRSVAEGKVHWELRVLESGERVSIFQVPITGELPYERLRGDVRGDKILLLRAAHGFDFSKKSPFTSDLVAVAELAQAAEKGGAQ